MDRRVIKVRTDPSRDECLSVIKMTLIRFNAFVQELDRQNYYSSGRFTAEHRDFLYEMAGRQYLKNMNAVLMGKQLEMLDDEALETVLEKCRRLSEGFGLCVDIPKKAGVADGEESHELDTYSDSTGMTVDYEFIRNHEGAAVLNGYVPQNADGTPIERSGTTIASGFDLGQQNTYDLNRIFGRDEVNQDLRDAYSPYLGLQGNNAINYLNEHPLTITQEQANRTDDSVMTQMLPSIRQQYENATNGNWDSLPNQAQTVLFDLGYQFGQNNGIPANIMTLINNGNYSGAADALEVMGNSAYTNRRNDEAALLRQLQNTNNSTEEQ